MVDNGDGTFTYTPDANANGSDSFTITVNDGTVDVTEAINIAIAGVNDLPTGSVTISGTATEGETLTAVTSTISDEDGPGDFSYQWFKDGLEIDGATASTFLVTQDVVGWAVSVAVSYTDGAENAESLTSLTKVVDRNVGIAFDPDLTEIFTIPVLHFAALVENDVEVVKFIANASAQLELLDNPSFNYSYIFDDFGNISTELYGDLSSIRITYGEEIVPLFDEASFNLEILRVESDDYYYDLGATSFGDGAERGEQSERLLIQLGSNDPDFVDGFTSSITDQASLDEFLLSLNDLGGTAIPTDVSYGPGQDGILNAIIQNDAPVFQYQIDAFSFNLNPDDDESVNNEIVFDASSTLSFTGSENANFKFSYVDLDDNLDTNVQLETSGIDPNSMAYNGVGIDFDASDAVFASSYVADSSVYSGFALGFNDFVETALPDRIVFSFDENPMIVKTQEDFDDFLAFAMSTDELRIQSLEPETSYLFSELPNVEVVHPITISGLLTVGSELNAAVADWIDPDGTGSSTFDYQWLRDGTDISGATASTYTLAQADVGAAISIRASYTDGGGTAESVTSAAKLAVTNTVEVSFDNQALDDVEFSFVSKQGETTVKTIIDHALDYTGVSEFSHVTLQSDTYMADINISDVIVSLRHIVGLDTLNGAGLEAADVDNNGDISIGDVISQLRHIVGLETITRFDLLDDVGSRITNMDNVDTDLQLILNGDVDLSTTLTSEHIYV